MQALFRLLFEAFNLLFFDFFSLLLSLSGFRSFRFLASVVSTPMLCKCFVLIFNQAINILLDTRCYIITFVIIEAVMAAQSSFEFTSVFREEAVVVF